MLTSPCLHSPLKTSPFTTHQISPQFKTNFLLLKNLLRIIFYYFILNSSSIHAWIEPYCVVAIKQNFLPFFSQEYYHSIIFFCSLIYRTLTKSLSLKSHTTRIPQAENLQSKRTSNKTPNKMQSLQQKASEYSGVDTNDALSIDDTNLFEKLGLQTFIDLSTNFYTRFKFIFKFVFFGIFWVNLQLIWVGFLILMCYCSWLISGKFDFSNTLFWVGFVIL